MNGLFEIPLSRQSGGITRYDPQGTLFRNDTLIVNQFGDGSEVEYWEDHTPHQPNQMWDRSFDDNAGFFTFKNQQFIYSMLSSTRPDKFIVAGIPNCILFVRLRRLVTSETLTSLVTLMKLSGLTT